MSQLQNFYDIKNVQNIDDKQYQFILHINKDHEIFKGHFPENPVTPGVCMLQIIKELTESQTEQKLQMKSAKNIKFMAIINPVETPQILVDLNLDKDDNTNDFIVKSNFSYEDPTTKESIMALKFSGIFSS